MSLVEFITKDVMPDLFPWSGALALTIIILPELVFTVLCINYFKTVEGGDGLTVLSVLVKAQDHAVRVIGRGIVPFYLLHSQCIDKRPVNKLTLQYRRRDLIAVVIRNMVRTTLKGVGLGTLGGDNPVMDVLIQRV